MNAPNEDRKQTDNMELLKQQAQQTGDCGPACGCHTTGSSGRMRWVLGTIVLIAAGAMVVRAVVTKSTATSTPPPAPSFTTPVASGSISNSQPAKTSIGTSIGAFSELNFVAATSDAVFVYLPAKDGMTSSSSATVLNSVKQTIETRSGIKLGLFNLKPGADYDQLAKQMSVPGVVAIVKGRGMNAISGDITEAKLIQGFVAASSSGGCGPSSGAGCCPK